MLPWVFCPFLFSSTSQYNRSTINTTMKQLSPTPPGCLYIPIHPPHTPFHRSQASISPTHYSILLKSHSSIEKGQLTSGPKRRCYGMVIHSFWKVISESPLFKIAVQNFRNKTLTTRDLVFHLLWAFSLYEKKSTKPWKTLYFSLANFFVRDWLHGKVPTF